jgi:UDP-2-acetamido-3-amino-2,3-dideoxy-glucuronate N-acetyltransferase
MSFIHPTVEVEARVEIGNGVKVWQLSHIREDASIGDNTTLGRCVYVGPGVKIGSNVKIQNLAMIYEPAEISDGVFIGPGVVLTNDTYPRAITPEGDIKTGADWEAVGVSIGHGASIGARAVCVAPVKIGMWALVGAGAVVTSDVKDFAQVQGCPAKQVAWVGKDGKKLQFLGNSIWECISTGTKFLESKGILKETTA